MAVEPGDLASTLSRVEQLEGELVSARQQVAELAHWREKIERLTHENAALESTRYQLPGRELGRLIIGLLIVAVGGFDLVASYGAPMGFPPFVGLQAALVAVLGGGIGAGVIGFFGPHRFIALGALAATGVVLVLKPYVAPCVHDWMGERVAFSMSSETHDYFLVTGIIAWIFTALLAGGTSARR